MSKTETETKDKDLPKCHFCGRKEWAEGNIVKSPYSNENIFVCFECSGIISVFFNSFVAGLLENIDTEDRVKLWSSEEATTQ